MTDTRAAHKRKKDRLQRRKISVRKHMSSTSERLRLVVYRSNRHIYAQIVDDVQCRTITGCSTLCPAIADKVAAAGSNIEKAKVAGEYLAGLAKEKGIVKVAFDRNGRKYHGRVKALAEGARSAGLEF